MLKHLGDDEVASELEAIANKWRFAWDCTLAAAAADATGTGHQQDGEDILCTVEGEVDYPKDDPDASRVGSPKLTLEPPRVVKEMRRRASEAN